MVIVQSQAPISGLDKGLVSLVSGRAQIVLFCSADSFLLKLLLFLFFYCLIISSSVLVARLRCELRSSLVRPFAST